MTTSRDAWAKWMKLYRKRHKGDRCTRCSTVGVGSNHSRCVMCRARDAERKHPEMEHDTDLHAELLERAGSLNSRCEASGITLRRLLAAGMSLQVDRIDSARGYVAGNVQIIASYLNALKGREESWPWWAVEEIKTLVAQAEAIVETRVYQLVEEGGF